MFQLEPGVIIWTIVNFLALLLVLWRFAWKPILESLDHREEKIKESLEKADSAQQEAENRLLEYKGLLENSKNEALEMIAKGKERGEETRKEIIEKAQKEASALVEQAKREIGLEREKAIDEIKKEAINLSVTVAGKILTRQLTEDDQKSFIQQATKEIQGES